MAPIRLGLETFKFSFYVLVPLGFYAYIQQSDKEALKEYWQMVKMPPKGTAEEGRRKYAELCTRIREKKRQRLEEEKNAKDNNNS